MEALGIDLKLIIAQIVNFLILFIILSKFLYKPIVKMLDDRQKKIERGISDSEAAEKCLGEAGKKAEKIREDAFLEADKIIKAAKKDYDEKALVIIKKANEQAEKIVGRANEEAALAKERALKEAKKELSSVVVMALDKIIENELSPEQKTKLTEKAIKEL